MFEQPLADLVEQHQTVPDKAEKTMELEEEVLTGLAFIRFPEMCLQNVAYATLHVLDELICNATICHITGFSKSEAVGLPPESIKTSVNLVNIF